MENFKQIAEDCLAGKLSGTFVLRNGKIFYSKTHLSATSLYALPYCIAGWCYSVAGNCYSGGLSVRDNDVIDFIPDNMQEQIKIDIPEGKVPVMEHTEKGVVITWKEKELTYTELLNEFGNNLNCIHTSLVNSASQSFHKKVEVLRKLTNIRNYFGKPKVSYDGVVITYEFDEPIIVDAKVCPIECSVIFAEEGHAQAAINMLGDELKYLFEPW